MKRLLATLVAFIALGLTAFAQVPQGFNYQAVVRNSAGQLMSNRTVSVRISILYGSETGAVIYQQTESLSTNANGLFTLIVGENSSSFASINWANGPYYILSEVDPMGGSDYTLSTTQKILAVPYAHYATYAHSLDTDYVYNERDPRFRAWGFDYDSLQGAPTRLSQFVNDLQFPYDSLQATVSGDTLFFGNNTYVILPHLGDTVGALSLSGDTLFLGSQYVILPDNTPSVSISGDTIFVGSQYVVLPDNTPAFSISGDTIFMGSQYVVLPNNTPTFSISGDTIFMGSQYVVVPDPNVSISGDTIFVGNQYVVLPDNAPAFSISGDTLFMGGQYVVLPDNTPTFSISGDTIFMGSQYVVVPNPSVSISGDTIFVGNQYVVLPDNTPAFSISGDTIFMGNQYVVLPDNTPAFSISGDTIFMGNQYVVLPDNTPTFSISGDTIFMGSQSVVLPDNTLTISGDTIFMGNQYVVIPTYIPTLNEVLSVSSNANSQIHNVYTPTAATDAANKLYVDSLVAVLNNRIDSLNDRIDSLNLAYSNNVDSLNQDIYNLQHPIIKGALPGVFSVSATTKVNFSKGNLQYRPRIKTWRFAEHQYDISGSSNNNVYMQNYCTSWIDLFGYGTSGWDGGASRYMPYETTTNDSEYAEATDGNDLTDFYANGDWGFYNPIINGGNQMATWRTLTYSEWTYLLTQRTNATSLRGMATVVSTPGYVLLPDNWELPAGQSFVNIDTSYAVNVYSASDWAVMEAAGAVFLPAAGKRVGSATSSIGTIGNYWTASHVNGTTGYSFHVGANSCALQSTITYSTGCSVRVVHEY